MDNRLTVAYVRLSQEDKNKSTSYSESIYNQLGLIKSYAKGMNLEIQKEYIDDGYSGTNFDRPSFEKLLDDIESGIINCVITKDMSRLGRNFIETAYYISEYFPKHNVRYIAINDTFDSNNLNDSNQEIMLGFKSLINERYVKEVSVKRKQVADIKTSEGQFIGFIAPYGYKIIKKGLKRTLMIDEYASKIVKRIFTEIASGKSRKEVADGLNKDKVIPPVLYLKMTLSYNKKYNCDWSSGTIYRIIKNETYMGKIVKRKSTKKSYLQKKRERIAIRDRQTIDNCHPLIITEKLFKEANEKLRTLKRKEKNNYNGLFSGLVICGECNRTMTACIRADRKNIQYYFCCTRVVDRKPCPNRTITDSKLKSIVSSTLKDIITNYVGEDKIISKATKDLIIKKRPKLKMSHLKENIELCNRNMRNLYLRKTKGEITLDQFVEMKKNETLLKKQFEEELQKIIELQNEDTRKEEILEQYHHFIDGDQLMNIALRDLVDKIIIYKDNTIQISFKFGLGEPQKIKLF